MLCHRLALAECSNFVEANWRNEAISQSVPRQTLNLTSAPRGGVRVWVGFGFGPGMSAWWGGGGSSSGGVPNAISYASPCLEWAPAVIASKDRIGRRRGR